MLYYFVSPDGDYLEKEDQVKGWFSKEFNPDMFTVKREAIAEQKRRIKFRIKELEDIIKELNAN